MVFCEHEMRSRSDGESPNIFEHASAHGLARQAQTVLCLLVLSGPFPRASEHMNPPLQDPMESCGRGAHRDTGDGRTSGALIGRVLVRGLSSDRREVPPLFDQELCNSRAVSAVVGGPLY